MTGYLGAAVPPACTVARKFLVLPDEHGQPIKQCGYDWDGHVCALPYRHPGGFRTGSVDHACGCGVMIDPIQLGSNHWDPLPAKTVAVVPCPKCGDVRHMVGSSGEPQRQCWSCEHEWTPESNELPQVAA